MQIYQTFFLEGHYFLDIQYDILLEEATARMQENQAKSKTTRVAGEEAQNAASVLGTACQGSSDPFYSIVTYYMKLFTSWT